MTLANKIVEIKVSIFNGLSYLIEKIAILFFNYPRNPGMPLIEPYDPSRHDMINYVSKLPVHTTMVPPPASPNTMLQAFFGNYPEVMSVERTFYEHPSDGFYNFYIPNYQNIFFLPDWLSEWIQINFDISIDDTPLQVIRQGLFLGLLVFMFLLDLRMKMFWFLTLNPYTRPWIYVISLTDWIFDFMTGFTPVVLGLDLSATLMLGIVGKVTDSLNNLVFTMPFLPSEGVPGKMRFDVEEEEVVDVVLFRYLPSLWYTHPIPDKLREFWYTQRPEILNFMKKNYGHLDIEFLPNRILKEVYEKEHVHKSLVDNIDNLSTNISCENSDHYSQLIDFLINNYINFHDSIYFNIDKIIT